MSYKKEVCKIGVYKITNPIGEVYIGGSVDVERRFQQHKKNSANTNLANSINDFGRNSHVFEIIEECRHSVLREREVFFIEMYKKTHVLMNFFSIANSQIKKYKQRIVFTIQPDYLEVISESECKEIAENAVKKECEYRLMQKTRNIYVNSCIGAWKVKSLK